MTTQYNRDGIHCCDMLLYYCKFEYRIALVYMFDLCVHVYMCWVSSKVIINYRTELIKPATELFRHNLTGTLEASVRATNAQYDENDILQRLDVRILEVY